VKLVYDEFYIHIFVARKLASSHNAVEDCRLNNKTSRQRLRPSMARGCEPSTCLAAHSAAARRETKPMPFIATRVRDARRNRAGCARITRSRRSRPPRWTIPPAPRRPHPVARLARNRAHARARTPLLTS
jgi:hypothetical protein